VKDTNTIFPLFVYYIGLLPTVLYQMAAVYRPD